MNEFHTKIVDDFKKFNFKKKFTSLNSDDILSLFIFIFLILEL